MKKFLLVFTFLFVCIEIVSATSMSVQVKQSILKSAPSFLSKNITILKYGDKVQKIKDKDDWINVKIKKKQGWIHMSALSDKIILLQTSAKNAPSSVSSDEMVLAGKGFNKQVESKYKSSHPTMRFDLVDKMQNYSISVKSQKAFAKEGKIGGDL